LGNKYNYNGGLMITHKVYSGMETTYEKVVTPADSYLSNAVTIDYLMSTPALLATVIEISWNMFKDLIPSDYLTVVRNFQFDHFHPTLVGEKILFKLKVEKIEDNRIYIVFSVYDYVGEFCNGRFEKAIVRNDKLLEAAYRRVKM